MSILGGRLVDITGPMRDGMWHSAFYPPTRIVDVPPMSWTAGHGLVRGQSIGFGSQAGTAIATGAHLHPAREDIASVALERLVVPATIAHVEAKARTRVTRDAVLAGLPPSRVVRAGEAVLVATGWDARWDDIDFLTDSPSLGAEVVDWAMDLGLSILGTDFPTWDPAWDEGFWPRFYASDVLPLAPVVGISDLGVQHALLVALPLRLVGSVGSPCRAFLWIDG